MAGSGSSSCPLAVGLSVPIEDIASSSFALAFKGEHAGDRITGGSAKKILSPVAVLVPVC